MAWRLSTQFAKDILGADPSIDLNVTGTTISFGDGDGIGATDTINDSGSGFGSVSADDWVLIVGGTNENVFAQVITAAAGKLEIAAGSLTAEAAGSSRSILVMPPKSIKGLLANGTIHCYTGSPPADADATESGVKLLELTKNGAAFTAGVATNGLNMGDFSVTTMKRLIDPATGLTEVWKGAGISPGGTVSWCRWYANDATTGASTTTRRMDGVVATSGGDLNMTNGNIVVTGVNSEVSDVSCTIAGT